MDKLLELLEDMDVPKRRVTDLNWLNRNLSVRNSGHPDFKEAMELIKELINA